MNYTHPMNILITGGAGFIGSHLTDKLVLEGHSVTVLDNLSTGRISNIQQHLDSKKVAFVEGSILDINLVNKLTSESEYVFHLAAAVGVFNIVNNPLASLLTNIPRIFWNRLIKMEFLFWLQVVAKCMERTLPTP